MDNLYFFFWGGRGMWLANLSTHAHTLTKLKEIKRWSPLWKRSILSLGYQRGIWAVFLNAFPWNLRQLWNVQQSFDKPVKKRWGNTKTLHVSPFAWPLVENVALAEEKSLCEANLSPVTTLRNTECPFQLLHPSLCFFGNPCQNRGANEISQ